MSRPLLTTNQHCDHFQALPVPPLRITAATSSRQLTKSPTTAPKSQNARAPTAVDTRASCPSNQLPSSARKPMRLLLYLRLSQISSSPSSESHCPRRPNCWQCCGDGAPHRPLATGQARLPFRSVSTTLGFQGSEEHCKCSHCNPLEDPTAGCDGRLSLREDATKRHPSVCLHLVVRC